MSRWALFVDAGWLFAAGSVSAVGERVPRRELLWDPPALVEAVVGAASALVPDSTELLRTYWYDGSPNRLPQGDQRVLAALPDVKLRLGRTARDGQKGVDGLIIHDLITHAYRRTIDDAVVVSGDEDLLDAIESAQANGTRVHLLEIPIGGITEALLRAVDRRGQLDEAFWREHLRRTTGEVAAAGPAPVVPAPVLPVPDAPVAAPVASPPRPSARPDWMEQPPPTAAPAPDWASRQQQLGEVVESGAGFAEDWSARASPDEFAELLAARPYLPRDLDAQLLRRAAPDGSWLDQGEKRALRDAFWTTLADCRPGAGA